MLELLPALQARLGPQVRDREPLARHASARVGGPADYFVAAPTSDALQQAVAAATELRMPWRVLGSASNLLIADDGVAGLVVKATSRGVVFETRDDGVVAEVEAGTLLAAVAQASAQRGYTGLEWAVNVPGTVGAAIVNNSGAFGSSTYEHLLEAQLGGEAGGPVWVGAASLQAAYRTTALKRGERRGVVLRGRFRLGVGDKAALAARIHEIQTLRRTTQPTGFSLGSMFMNPPGDYAGRLIEAVGLKGFRQGKVEVSALHANFMLAEPGACAAHIARLLVLVRDRVQRATGVWLAPEVELAGRWSPDVVEALRHGSPRP